MNPNQGANRKMHPNQKMNSELPISSTQSPRGQGSREQAMTRETPHSQSSQLMEMVGKNLPQESRENLERIVGDASGFIREARTYVRENPGEAAGLALTAAGVVWALFGTKPGRRVFEAGSAAAMPVVSSWIAKNFPQSSVH